MRSGGRKARRAHSIVEFLLEEGALELSAHHHLEGGTLERRGLQGQRQRAKARLKAQAKGKGQSKRQRERVKG
jgi:hypothetical protein